MFSNPYIVQNTGVHPHGLFDSMEPQNPMQDTYYKAANMRSVIPHDKNQMNKFDLNNPDMDKYLKHNPNVRANFENPPRNYPIRHQQQAPPRVNVPFDDRMRQEIKQYVRPYAPTQQHAFPMGRNFAPQNYAPQQGGYVPPQRVEPDYHQQRLGNARSPVAHQHYLQQRVRDDIAARQRQHYNNAKYSSRYVYA